MTLDESIQAHRLSVLQRAQESGNVVRTCRALGISRTRFYRWRQRFDQYGVDGLHPKRVAGRAGRPPRTTAEQERSVIGLALAWPTVGPLRLSQQLSRTTIWRLSPSTIQRVLHRSGLGTRRARLAVVESHSARTSGLLTERTRRALQRARRSGRHVQAARPGALVCVDLFYVGHLKGVGRVWQVTACDAASSYATARILPALNARTTAAFLREVLVPLYRRAGWPVERILTDNGAEFKGAFDLACRELGVRHTRTQPGHAWTNGFVERLHQTLLHEHWRIAFRRRYFTSREQLQASLMAYLEYYNRQRPHQGYRLRGRTPASLLWGAAGA
jgi:transposase InsO family protein